MLDSHATIQCDASGMNRRCPCAFAIGLLLMATGRLVPAQDVPAQSPARSGIETQYFDHGVRPQDNFYQYVNGKWLANIEIPADRPAYGAASKLYDDVQKKLAEILEGLSTTAIVGSAGSDESKIGALYGSFLDEARIERLGAQPLAAELARIAAVRSKSQLPELVAHLQKIGVTVPFSITVRPDSRDITRYSADLQQDGLGLPDRDYYVKNDATTLRLIVREYQQHIQTVLALLGDRDAAGEATAIVSLETRLAKVQWDKRDSADAQKTYNSVGVEQLESIAPGFGWRRYLTAVGIDRAASYLIGSEPSYLRSFAQLVGQAPLSSWKAYFRWHLLSDFSPYLSKPYADAAFDFFGTTLQGIPQNQSRQRRGLLLVDQYMGQALGRLYVRGNFPASSKARAEQLVGNLLEAFRREIGTLGWMGDDTKQQAQLKLSRITIKIGYPNRWRDYSALKIQANDLVGNVMRAASFEFERRLSKLGRPIDRGDWDGTPQAVNASYNPQNNEIMFPAAILQPPFFDAGVDDAANYGGIGMVIGHELSHAFDDQGSQYDGDGKLRDWWTTEDHSRFDALTQPLIDEYDHFMPLRGRQINGKRTLNENIADNAGLAIALKAYHLSLNERTAPVIDGLTGDQRFFMGFAQAWREKLRDSFAVEMIESDPHAISYVRVLGTLINQTAFYDTFDVEQGDAMYLPPEKRVVIW
jgi:predicted metalloendopeptidase